MVDLPKGLIGIGGDSTIDCNGIIDVESDGSDLFEPLGGDGR